MAKYSDGNEPPAVARGGSSADYVDYAETTKSGSRSAEVCEGTLTLFHIHCGLVDRLVLHHYFTVAMHSISTLAPKARPVVPNVLRAGIRSFGKKVT